MRNKWNWKLHWIFRGPISSKDNKTVRNIIIVYHCNIITVFFPSKTNKLHKPSSIYVWHPHRLCKLSDMSYGRRRRIFDDAINHHLLKRAVSNMTTLCVCLLNTCLKMPWIICTKWHVSEMPKSNMLNTIFLFKL